MRTAGQGQAAVPRERGGRRRSPALPGALLLGRGKTSPGLSRIVERYHFPVWRGTFVLSGRFHGSARFFCLFRLSHA